MMTRSTKRTATKRAQPKRATASKKPAARKAASKTTARKSISKPKKESFFHKILTAEGWRRLMSGRKEKATARKK